MATLQNIKNLKGENKKMEYSEENLRIVLTNREKEKCFMRLGMICERYNLKYVYSNTSFDSGSYINGIKITNGLIDYNITDFKVMGFTIMAKLVENGTSSLYGIKELLNYIKGK